MAITMTIDAIDLATRIPEIGKVRGLEYGAHYTGHGWCGYYVRPRRGHGGRWGVARMTPDSDELVGSSRAILAAIRAEWAEVHVGR